MIMIALSQTELEALEVPVQCCVVHKRGLFWTTLTL